MEESVDKNTRDSELLNKINYLFGKLYKYNLSLLEKSNDLKNGYNGEEVFDFFITSHGESFLKSVYIGHIESKGLMLNCRSIIGGLALKEMLKKGKITPKQLELLKYQDGLLEKKNYKKFSSIAPEAMFPKQMEENYDFCREKFVEALKDEYSLKEIEKIIYSNIPFLCDPKITFSHLVSQHLSKEVSELYKILSVIVHPNPNFEFNVEFTAQAIVIVIKLLENEYDHLDGSGYTIEKHFLLTASSHESDKFFTTIRKIASSLESIKNDFNKNFNNNYVSDTMHAISMTIQEMAVDRIFGFQEQVKCKIKPLIEIIASFYENYLVESDVENRYKLFLQHTQLKVSKALGNEYALDEAYSVYKAIYSNGVSKNVFDEQFVLPTGYSIKENGETSSINSMVRNVAALIKPLEGKLSFSETLMIDYVESQMLSHANGYMWFSNSGAFSDTNNVIPEVCFLLMRIFELLKIFFNDGFKETKKYTFRKTSNIFRDSIKELYNAIKTINELQKKPMAYLNK